MKKRNTYENLLNSRTICISLIFVLLGILILVANSYIPDSFTDLKTVLRDIASFIIASIGVALAWELFSKKAFLSELLSATKLSEEIMETRIIGVSSNWHGQINWSELFNSSDEIKIFFMYGRTWRNINRENLASFARRNNTKAIIVLPDIQNNELITEIAKSIQLSKEELITNINEAIKDFIDLFTINNSRGESKLIIWGVSAFPVYSYYEFDNKSIFTLYTHCREKTEVPTFILERGGSLYSFFEYDFNSVTNINSGLCRKIFPS